MLRRRRKRRQQQQQQQCVQHCAAEAHCPDNDRQFAAVFKSGMPVLWSTCAQQQTRTGHVGMTLTRML